MSVIGRLDEQVDKVLISPLQRKNKQESNEQQEEEELSTAREVAQTKSDSSKTNETARDELPVWLL